MLRTCIRCMAMPYREEASHSFLLPSSTTGIDRIPICNGKPHQYLNVTINVTLVTPVTFHDTTKESTQRRVEAPDPPLLPLEARRRDLRLFARPFPPQNFINVFDKGDPRL